MIFPQWMFFSFSDPFRVSSSSGSWSQGFVAGKLISSTCFVYPDLSHKLHRLHPGVATEPVPMEAAPVTSAAPLPKRNAHVLANSHFLSFFAATRRSRSKWALACRSAPIQWSLWVPLPTPIRATLWQVHPPMFIFIKQRGLNKSFDKSKTYLTPPMLKLFWKMCMLQVWRCMVQCVGQWISSAFCRCTSGGLLLLALHDACRDHWHHADDQLHHWDALGIQQLATKKAEGELMWTVLEAEAEHFEHFSVGVNVAVLPIWSARQWFSLCVCWMTAKVPVHRASE